MAQEEKLFRLLQERAGVSRRTAQALIAAGEVEVDGVVESDPFRSVDAAAIATLSLRGHPLALAPAQPRIYRFYKPQGMLCSHDDPFSGNTVGRVLRAEGFIGYTWVGRLDQDAEGLLLVTNSGDVVQALTHPRYEVEKTYRASLDRDPGEAALTRALATMRQGIEDDGETLHIVDGQVSGRPRALILHLIEGRKHEVKRLIARCGLRVTRLERLSVGPVRVDGLSPGVIERLPHNEEEALFRQTRERLAAHGVLQKPDL